MTQQGLWGPEPAAFALVFIPDLAVVLVGAHVCVATSLPGVCCCRPGCGAEGACLEAGDCGGLQ